MKRALHLSRVDSVGAATMSPSPESHGLKISGTQGPGGIEPVTVERQSSQPAAGNWSETNEDSLTLSSAARAREAASTHPRFGVLSVQAHLNSELADQLAYDYGQMEYHPMLDLRGIEGAGTGPIRYSATGQPVTPESEALFERLAASFQAASLALYEEERAKGTEAADIFDKLIALGNAQPTEFRDGVDWDATTG